MMRNYLISIICLMLLMVLVACNNENIVKISTTDWEEYPNNIAKEVNELYEYPYINENNLLSAKTFYSIAKNTSEHNQLIDSIYGTAGDGTDIIEKSSNYKQYEYTENIMKYNEKILYKVALFNDMYYHPTYSEKGDKVENIDTLVKNQYDELVINKDYKHYGNVDESLYYQIDKVVVMNGNNSNKEDYENNSRAKTIKVTLDNDDEYIIELQDTNRVQTFDIGYKQETIEKAVDIEIEVLETYDGRLNNDIYISDIQFAISSNIPQGR